MTGPLATVTERARARATATRDYHTAILRARAAGHTLAAIATAGASWDVGRWWLWQRVVK